jgi:sulfur carrier protein
MNTLRINGVEKQFPDGPPAVLSDLIGRLGIAEATVVAEIDGQIVPRQQFARTKLSGGQKIELIRIVGGG